MEKTEYSLDNIINLTHTILDDSASTLVGVLLKRIEVLEREKVLTPSLYKSLTKEIVYEQFRAIKRLYDAHFIPSITFKSKER